MAKRERAGFVPGWTPRQDVDLPDHLSKRLEESGLFFEKRGEWQPVEARLISPSGQECGAVLLGVDPDNQTVTISSHRCFQPGDEVTVVYQDSDARHSVYGPVKECGTGKRPEDPAEGIYFIRVQCSRRKSDPTR